jgi:tellurite resistance protein TehA-like permease
MGALASTVRGLPPGYFALVMATGIVSLGLKLGGFEVTSAVLLVLAVLAYTVLLVLFAARLMFCWREFSADVQNPQVSFGFFTFVAGSNVLAVRLAAEGMTTPAVVLAIIGLAAWLVFGYVVPWAALLGQGERPGLHAVNGTWFIWSVASHSVAVSAAVLDTALPQFGNILGIVAVLSWSVGIVLYSGIAIYLSLRVIIHGIRPEDFQPQFWVAMGAMAIAVVAGSRIVGMSATPMVESIRALAAGSSVVFWCFAAWLIPPLVAGGIWRHWVHKVPLRYEAGLWSIIFPLGMFAVASMSLGRAERLPIVETVGEVWLWVAVVGWALVAVSLVVRVVHGVSEASHRFVHKRANSVA